MQGIITKVMGRYCTVRYDDGSLNAVLRGKIKQDESLRRFSEPAAVGDVVEFEIGQDGMGVIAKIRPRKNCFTRKDRGRSKEDLIAANIDQIVVVQSFTQPDYNLRFADRLAVRAEKENIPVVLCMNKLDLAIDEDIIYLESYYSGVSIDLVYTSTINGEGISDLARKLKKKTSILIGSSGVGKSSIMNRIVPGLDLRTTGISESTGKGRHTTTNVEMIQVSKDINLIDTPGMREFGLMDIHPDELSRYFSDFREHSAGCRFSPCTHDHEPGCVVKKVVESGNIMNDRYVSYLNILYSLKEYHAARYD